MTREPSGVEKAILVAILRSVTDRGYPPSMRELCATVGIPSTDTVKRHLDQMEGAGFIRRTPGAARAITVLMPVGGAA